MVDFTKYNKLLSVIDEFPWLESAIKNNGNRSAVLNSIFGIEDIIDDLDNFLNKYDFSKDLLGLGKYYQYIFGNYVSSYETTINSQVDAYIGNAVRFISSVASDNFDSTTIDGIRFIIKTITAIAKYGTTYSFYSTILSNLVFRTIRVSNLQELVKTKILNELISYGDDDNNTLVDANILADAAGYKHNYIKDIVSHINETISIFKDKLTKEQLAEFVAVVKDNQEVYEFIKNQCNIDVDNLKISIYSVHATEDDISSIISQVVDKFTLKDSIDGILSSFLSTNNKISSTFIINFIKKAIIENPKIVDRRDKKLKRNIVHEFIDDFICKNMTDSIDTITEFIMSGDYDNIFKTFSEYFYDPYFITAQITQTAYEQKQNRRNIVATRKMIRRLIALDCNKFLKVMLQFIRNQSEFPKTCSKKIQRMLTYSRLCKEYQYQTSFTVENYDYCDDENFDPECEIIKILSLNDLNQNHTSKLLSRTPYYRECYDESLLYRIGERKHVVLYDDHEHLNTVSVAKYILTGNIDSHDLSRLNNGDIRYLTNNKLDTDDENKEARENAIKNIYKLIFAYSLDSVKLKYSDEHLAAIVKLVEDNCGDSIVLYNSYNRDDSYLESRIYSYNEDYQAMLSNIYHLELMKDYIKIFENLNIFKNVSIPDDSILIPIVGKSNSRVLSETDFVNKYFDFGKNTKDIIKQMLPNLTSEIGLNMQTDAVLKVADFVKKSSYDYSGVRAFLVSKKFVDNGMSGGDVYSLGQSTVTADTVVDKMREAYHFLLNILHNKDLVSDSEFSAYETTIDEMFNSIECGLMLS